MEINDWAEKEVELVCKAQDSDYNEKSFDYVRACHQSALKAFKALTEDNHSGFSINVTMNILKRLVDHKPLTEITEDDFKGAKAIPYDHESNILVYQCPRYESLFKKEVDGKLIGYSDHERVKCVDITLKSIFHNGFILEQCKEFIPPITLPYYPFTKGYRIYADSFLFNNNGGDFDTLGIYYIKTPTDEKIEVNRYFKENESKDGDAWLAISKEEYEERKANKIK